MTNNTERWIAKVRTEDQSILKDQTFSSILKKHDPKKMFYQNKMFLELKMASASGGEAVSRSTTVELDS